MNRYKCGYVMLFPFHISTNLLYEIKLIASECERLVVGIPSYDVVRVICGKTREYNEAKISESLLEERFIDEVVILDESELSYSVSFGRIGYDFCIYSSLYGRRFEEDRDYLKSHGVDYRLFNYNLSTINNEYDALGISLTQLQENDYKIALFGTGAYFDIYMDAYGDKAMPSYAIDNDSTKWGSKKRGISIVAPDEIANEDIDKIIVVVCAKKPQDMINQIRAMGDYDYRTLLRVNEIAILEEYYTYSNYYKDMWNTLDRLQRINVDLLARYNDVCRKYNIKYSLNYGSLLGALRHGGFIPWDNDVDVIMTREELHKLEVHKDEFDGDYYWADPTQWGEKKYYDSVARIGYKYAHINLDEGELEFYNQLNNRIHLDLFLIDKTYDNLWGKLQRYELAVLYGLMNAYRHKSFFFDYDKKMMLQNKILCFIGRMIPLKFLRALVAKVANRYNSDNNATHYFISNCALSKLWLLFPVNMFKEYQDVAFEDVNAMVTNDPDGICRAIFGDYMKLPPIKARIPHMGRRFLSSKLFVFDRLDEM